jgi:hypothetical protein
MGEIVDLKPVSLIENREFIVDMCRFAEGIVTEKSLRKKYRLFDEAAWEKLNDDELVRAIEEESVRRVRDGSCKREKSQQLITKAPAILDGIAGDVSASPRHRIDAIRTLDTFAANGPAGVPASDRFIIQINLGADTLTFNKSIKPDPNDIDPNDPTPPQGPFLAFQSFPSIRKAGRVCQKSRRCCRRSTARW